MTYASEMFGWYAGNVTADTYFCPERQADYFGGFYIKDAPAVGNEGYKIDETITGEKGQKFLDALDTTQRAAIMALWTSSAGTSSASWPSASRYRPSFGGAGQRDYRRAKGACAGARGSYGRWTARYPTIMPRPSQR